MTERSRGARYAISALKSKGGTLAAEIVQLESQIKARKHGLEHVDACLRLLDPSVDVDAIPNKRMRKADGVPLTAADIVGVVVADGGLGDDARAAIRARVRSNLAYLEKRGKVEKIGRRAISAWRLLA